MSKFLTIPRTDEEQAKMRRVSQAETLIKRRGNRLPDSDYFNRVCFWRVEARGNISIPTSINFHPQLWRGTQAEFDEIDVRHLQGNEGLFKITDVCKFATYEDHKNNTNELI